MRSRATSFKRVPPQPQPPLPRERSCSFRGCMGVELLANKVTLYCLVFRTECAFYQFSMEQHGGRHEHTVVETIKKTVRSHFLCRLPILVGRQSMRNCLRMIMQELWRRKSRIRSCCARSAFTRGEARVPSTHLSYLLWFSNSISREDEVLLRGKRKRGSTKRCSGWLRLYSSRRTWYDFRDRIGGVVEN